MPADGLALSTHITDSRYTFTHHMFEGPQLSIIQVLHVCIQEPNLVFTLPAYVLALTSDDYTIIIIILEVSLSIKDFGYGFVDPITSSKIKSCGISNANELEYVYANQIVLFKLFEWITGEMSPIPKWMYFVSTSWCVTACICLPSQKKCDILPLALHNIHSTEITYIRSNPYRSCLPYHILRDAFEFRKYQNDHNDVKDGNDNNVSMSMIIMMKTTIAMIMIIMTKKSKIHTHCVMSTTIPKRSVNLEYQIMERSGETTEF